MVAKVHDYLNIGRQAIRPSVRLLLAEYVRYALDRAWAYYPSSLPASMLAEKPRNGRINRNLSIPLEDLQDGWTQSGQVGQEVYGSGCAFVMTTRHYRRLTPNILLFCDYPVFDFQPSSRNHKAKPNRWTFRLAGTRQAHCTMRVVQTDVTCAVPVATLIARSRGRTRRLKPDRCGEGHLVFQVAGDQRLELCLSPS